MPDEPPGESPEQSVSGPLVPDEGSEADDGADEGDANADLRSALRHLLPPGVSASVILASGRPVYVNLRDVSRTGACIVRRGGLDVRENENVLFEVSDFEIQQKVSLPSRVQWVNASGYNTVVGLVFDNGPLLPGTLLDTYLDQSLKGRGGDG